MVCLASPYKYDVIERISELVQKQADLREARFDVKYFNAYGEEPGCYEQGHEHKTHQESAERSLPKPCSHLRGCLSFSPTC